MEKSPKRFLKDYKILFPNSIILPCKTHKEEAVKHARCFIPLTSLQLQLHGQLTFRIPTTEGNYYNSYWHTVLFYILNTFIH